MEILTPWIMIVIGVLCLVIYILAMALNKITARLVATNDRLLVLLAHRDGGRDAAQALLTATKPPQRPLPGISTKKPKQNPLKQPDKKGKAYSVQVGVN